MKSKALYLVKESIAYEKDNVWVVAADTEQEAVDTVIEFNSVNSWNITTYRLSNVSDYTENQIVQEI